MCHPDNNVSSRASFFFFRVPLRSIAKRFARVLPVNIDIEDKRAIYNLLNKIIIYKISSIISDQKD